MATVYRIKPLEKKSVSTTYEMFRENTDGSVSWFNVEDTYRWGQGFIEEDMDCNLPYKDSKIAYCKNNCGWGAELDDSISCSFEYSDDLTDEDKQAIEDAYYEGSASWIYDGDHEWQVEDDSILVLAPFQVDLCDEDGTIIKENIELKDRPDPRTSWPFSQANPKPEEE